MSELGTGTRENPFLIADTGAFLGIGKNLSASYRLTADLDFCGETITPMGTSKIPFTGELDGDGHSIKNFKVTSSEAYTGIFRYAKLAGLKNLSLENGEVKATGSYTGALAGYLDGCTVENIAINEVVVSGRDYCGSLAGYVNKGSLTGCFAGGNGQVTGEMQTGGLVGQVMSAPAERCYARVKVQGSGHTGGLIGNVSGSGASVKQCYAMGSVAASSTVGGLAGFAGVMVSDCFAAGSVTSNSTSAGGLTGYASSAQIINCYCTGSITKLGNGFTTVYGTTTVTNSYFDKVAAGVISEDKYNVGMLTKPMLTKAVYTNWDFESVWDITEGSSYPYLRRLEKPEDLEPDLTALPGGSGTQADPFLISNAKQFELIRYALSSSFRLTADIDMNGGTITPIGSPGKPFTGAIDGAGHAICHFSISKGSNGADYTGLFGYISKASIKNLILREADITNTSTTKYIGALAGYITDSTTENISLSDIRINGGEYAGALAGYVSRGSLTGCAVKDNVTITGTKQVGGLIGTAYEIKISGCSVQGESTVSGTSAVGGLIGNVYGGVVELCRASISTQGKLYTGGLAGQISGESTAVLSKCCSTESVTGNDYTGGLIGTVKFAAISDCYVSGSVTSTSTTGKTAGLAGFLESSSSTIQNCLVTGRISPGGSILLNVSGGAKIVNSFFDTFSTGTIMDNKFNIGKSTASLSRKAGYPGWDFETVWDISEGKSYPYLRGMEKPDMPALDLGSFPKGAGTQEDPYLIGSTEEFDFIRYELGSFYRLTSDIDFGNKTILPVGSPMASFCGGLDGDGYAILNFQISFTENCAGLFRLCSLAKLQNLAIRNASLSQPSSCTDLGTLSGILRDCTVENISLADISISGNARCGILAGSVEGGSIAGCSIRGNSAVSGSADIGGFAGTSAKTVFRDCLLVSGGSISGSTRVGGLTGSMTGGTAERCRIAAEVKGGDYVGGIAGNAASTPVIQECSVQGNVTGKAYVGGLTGAAMANFCDCYFQGNVLSTPTEYRSGGLIGYSNYVSIKNSYAACGINAQGAGLFYRFKDTGVTNSYFDCTLAGKSSSVQYARTTEQLYRKETYAGWDWTAVWKEPDGSYPVLRKTPELSYQIPLKPDACTLDYFSASVVWPETPGATQYEISCSGRIIRTERPEAVLEDLLPDRVYEVRIRPKTGDIIGVWSEPITVRTKKLPFVDGVHCTGKGSDSIEMTWNAMEDVQGYEVEYNGRILSISENSCVLEGLQEDVPYVICVRALMAGGKKISGSPIMEKLFTVTPQSDYGREFITKCEDQTWFLDEVENLLNLKGKSLNTIRSREDFAAIYAIGLANRGISGSIPRAIGELYALEYLYLGNNDLGGELPEELAGLEKLKEVDLSGNRFTQ